MRQLVNIIKQVIFSKAYITKYLRLRAWLYRYCILICSHIALCSVCAILAYNFWLDLCIVITKQYLDKNTLFYFLQAYFCVWLYIGLLLTHRKIIRYHYRFFRGIKSCYVLAVDLYLTFWVIVTIILSVSSSFADYWVTLLTTFLIKRYCNQHLWDSAAVVKALLTIKRDIHVYSNPAKAQAYSILTNNEPNQTIIVIRVIQRSSSWFLTEKVKIYNIYLQSWEAATSDANFVITQLHTRADNNQVTVFLLENDTVTNTWLEQEFFRVVYPLTPFMEVSFSLIVNNLITFTAVSTFITLTLYMVGKLYFYLRNKF